MFGDIDLYTDVSFFEKNTTGTLYVEGRILKLETVAILRQMRMINMYTGQTGKRKKKKDEKNEKPAHPIPGELPDEVPDDVPQEGIGIVSGALGMMALWADRSEVVLGCIGALLTLSEYGRATHDKPPPS